MQFWCESGSQKHSRGFGTFASGDDDLLVRNRRTSPAANTPFTLVSHFASMIICPCGYVRLRLRASWCSAADQLDENTGQFDVVNIAADTISISRPTTLLPSPFTSVVCAFRKCRRFSGCAVCPAEPGRLSFWRKFQQRYVLNDTRQVNCRFTPELPPPITATRLPLNSGPCSAGSRSRLWCDTDLRPERSVAPFCTGRHDNAACFQYRARAVSI